MPWALGVVDLEKNNPRGFGKILSGPKMANMTKNGILLCQVLFRPICLVA